MATINEVRVQAVTGVTAPQTSEALIREAYPSVARFPAVASAGRTLIHSYIGAPLGWGVMLFFYFLKILPFGALRYALTNRRLMVLRGWKQCSGLHMVHPEAPPSAEVALADIDEIRILKDVNSEFFRSATLEIVSRGQVVLTLVGVSEPESLRHAILNACRAWAPKAVATPAAPAQAS
jgi:hypothetical protein